MQKSSKLMVFYSLVVTAFFLVSLGARANDPITTINVADYGLNKDDLSDNTAKFLTVLNAVKQKSAKRIVFPTGRYDFYPLSATEKYLFVSNNDEGLKRIALPLFNLNDLEIDGQGSTFIFHGFINPFVIENSNAVTLKNFSVDFARSFHQEATILAKGEGYLDVHFNEHFPYKINNAGILQFVGLKNTPPGYRVNERLERRKQQSSFYPYSSLLEFDVAKRETAYLAKDLWTGTALPAKQLLGKRNVRIFLPKISGKVGNIMTFSPKSRNHPAIIASASENLVLDNLVIHHAQGMGVIAQNSHNITIKNSKVTPSKGRIVSTTADATHFVNCSGKISLINNLFENQKDDATNIHGIYAQVDTILDETTLLVRLQHPQQYGFDLANVGDELELVQGESLMTYGVNKVSNVQRISKELIELVLIKPIDKRLQIGDSVAVVRDYPEVLIKGNIIRRNRARGMLLNCRGKTVVEDNYFHSPGAAILFEGDAMFWFEQGGVSDVVIRNNVFDNNNFGVWGKAVIEVAAGISKKYQQHSRYNKNILIEGNTFNMFDNGLLINLFSVDGLTFQNNIINKTTAYPARKVSTPFYQIKFSENIIKKGNKFNGF